MVKGSGVRLAARAGSWPLCEHGSCVDLLWTDLATGLAAGPGEGAMKQKNLISLPTLAEKQSILAMNFLCSTWGMLCV